MLPRMTSMMVDQMRFAVPMGAQQPGPAQAARARAGRGAAARTCPDGNHGETY